MPVFRGRLKDLQAIAQIGVQPFVPTAPELGPAALAISMPLRDYRALIDTGAQRTCLTNSVVSAEKLVRHGKKVIKNVHSANVHGLYLANIGFLFNGSAKHLNEENGWYGLSGPVEVINIADNDRFDAIIGMDVLKRFDFSLSRCGDFVITF